MKSKKITRQKLNFFLKQHASSKKTLDIGCGNKYYNDLFTNKINIDIDKNRQPDIVASVYDLPFNDNEFDNILCLEVLEHLFEPAKAIAEMNRVLKPDGKLILSTRFIFPLHDAPEDYFRYTKYGLQRLFKNWQVKSLESETHSLESIAVLLQRLIFQVKYKNNKILKLFLLFLTKIFLFLNKFIKQEFGNIEQTKTEKDVLTSGYYLVAFKK